MTARARGFLSGATRWHLAGGLALSAALCVAPQSWTDRLRGLVLDSLRPGQQLAEAGLSWGRTARKLADVRVDAAARLAELEAEVERLSIENDALRGQCSAALLAAQPAATPGEGDADPLLVSQLIPARRLGRQAQAHLAAAVCSIALAEAEGEWPGGTRCPEVSQRR
jgi:hypothetical protein